ncbi:MAG: hypothetical protein J6T17_00220 [Clostridia bacterium]|nr:hypothetical protein [Clostridia bacterium]
MYTKDTTNNTIEFRYKRDVLFNDVSLMSNYMSKNLSTKDGNSLTDDYAISDDERDLVYISIRATLPDIYEAMVKITNAVSSAFEDDKVISDEHYVSFTMQDNGAYNANVLTMVDASLYNSLKYGTLKEVYSTVVQPEFYNTCANRFVGELYKLKQRLFQMKKKSVVSSLT